MSTAVTAAAGSDDEPVASFTVSPPPASYSSGLLLNFPFAPIFAADAVQPDSSSSSSSSPTDLSLSALRGAAAHVRDALSIHLVCDDWSAVTVSQLQHRLAAVYQQAAQSQPQLDVTVILPSALSAATASTSASLPLTYIADSRSTPGRLLQLTVSVPQSVSVLLCCDYGMVAQPEEAGPINAIIVKKKKQRDASGEDEVKVKAKRRSAAQIKGEKDATAARITQLVAHTDNLGGLHIPRQMSVTEPSAFAAQSARLPPLLLLLRDDKDDDSFSAGPLYQVDWQLPTPETLSGLAQPPVTTAIAASSSSPPSAPVFPPASASSPLSSFRHVVLGGTFDHFHIGHKLLLSTAAFLSSSSILVGVTAASMLSKKKLAALVQSNAERCDSVSRFLAAVRGGVEARVQEISTPEGPTVEDAGRAFDCIVASEETMRGATDINDKRQRLRPPLPVMSVVELPIFSLPAPQLLSSSSSSSSSSSAASLLSLHKLSSTAKRFSLLSRYLGRSHPHPWSHPASSSLHSCYVVGLTGGIASGKSSISQHLQRLGARVIDCDRVGHACYEQGEEAYSRIVETWGAGVLDAKGDIDRRKLGPIVFAQPQQMQQLNSILWPEIKRKVEAELLAYGRDDVVVVEAAVLLEAGWADDSSLVDELWVAFVDSAEAVRRVQERNRLDREEAQRRVDSQLGNDVRLQRADVLLTTAFEVEVTREMCAEAWRGLQDRVSHRLRSLSRLGVRERWEWLVRRMYRRSEGKGKSKATAIAVEEEAEQDGDDTMEEEDKTPVKVKKERRGAEKMKVEPRAEDDEAGAEVRVKVEGSNGVATSSFAGPPSSLLDVLLHWWSVLPHTEAVDAMRLQLFALFDQQRPSMTFPEEVSGSFASRCMACCCC